MDDLKELSLKAHKAIFEGKKSVSINDIKYPIKKFSSGRRYIAQVFDGEFKDLRKKKSWFY